jgi:pyruvate/2-oxoglutarate dehydrogenase complex dihydrolipoamide acyltransferase (E2) component
VSSSRTDTLVDVTMPQMGVSMAEGTLVTWHKRVGDPVVAEETICEISTDKIDSEVPAPAAGRLAEILVEPEETVPVGAVLARIATDVLAGDRSETDVPPDEHLDGEPAMSEPVAGEPVAASAPASGPAPAPAPASGPPAPAPAPASGPEAPASAPASEPAALPAVAPGAPAHHAAANGANGANGGGDRRRVYSPVVQRIAASEGVDLEQVPGTGRAGRVSKQDVLAFIQRGGGGEQPLHIESPYREPEAPAAEPGGAQSSRRAGEQAGERLSRMRRSIAEHMLRSLHTAAHCTSIVEADFSGVEAARRALGLTHLPFVARSVIDALRAHPDLNATLEDETLTRHAAVNLGIAVSLDRDGLIVPVIHDAHELAPEGLARRISELARRARAGELTPDDVRGATFTITNPGGYGTLASTPIINQPQVAILDLEAVVKRAVVVTDVDGRDSIAIRPMAFLCLSWDHRALDGAIAAQFLSTLRRGIESWRAE